MGCPADGQVGSIEPPRGKPVAVNLPGAIAARLAYYQSAQGPGVLAPRGWHCRSWYGSNGAFLAVTPEEIPAPYFPIPRITGPVVYIAGIDAETSGRFTVAVTAARLFPKSTRDFVAKIKAEEPARYVDFDVKPFPADQLHYLSGRAVEFVTPADKEGLGTQGMLLPSSLPIRGLIALDPEEIVEGERELFVRLPDDLLPLSHPIFTWEKPCLIQAKCLRLDTESRAAP